VTIKILSAGAPKGGVRACADAFEARNDETVETRFETAPVIYDLVGRGETDADLVVTAVNSMDEFLRAGLVLPETIVVVGSVRTAVVVHRNTPMPDISSAETLASALKSVDGIAYNQASSGTYIETMMGTLGIDDDVRSKTERPANAAGVIAHLVVNDGVNIIGFGQETEILRHIANGEPIVLVGTLPGDLANLTSYMAAVLTGRAAKESALSLAEFMGSEAGLALFDEAGVK